MKDIERVRRVTEDEMERLESERGTYVAVYILNPKLDYIVGNVNFHSRERWGGEERIAIVDAVLELEKEIRKDILRIPYLDVPIDIVGKERIAGERLQICPGVGLKRTLKRDPRSEILLSGEEQRNYQEFKKKWNRLKDKDAEWRSVANSIYVNSLTLLDTEYGNVITMDRPRRATGRVKKMMKEAGSDQEESYLKPLEVKELFYGGGPSGGACQYEKRFREKEAKISTPVLPTFVARSLPNLGIREYLQTTGLKRGGAVATSARVDEKALTILNEDASIVTW